MLLVQVLTLMLMLIAPAWADIYEWRDASGHRHFTNNLVNIPQTRQADARVIVVGIPLPGGDRPTAPAEATEPRREPVVIYDTTRQPDPYELGVRDGLALARTFVEPEEPNVYIQGPLAIANASPTVDFSPWYPVYGPLVTTSFDRGRSRHLTLRMLLQEQFQLDRDGPFAVDLVRAPRGRLNLNPFLSRGLPRDQSRGRGGHHRRVITR